MRWLPIQKFMWKMSTADPDVDIYHKQIFWPWKKAKLIFMAVFKSLRWKNENAQNNKKTDTMEILLAQIN